MRFRCRSAMYDAVRNRLVARRAGLSEDRQSGRPDERRTVRSGCTPAQRTGHQGDPVSREPSLRLALALLAAVAVGGCTAMAGNAYDNARDEVSALAPKDVRTKAKPAIKQMNIDRITIL